MKRTFNYTGRERIKREKISITINRENGTITSFILDRLDLNDLNLPQDAAVYVEAYHRTELKRFDCGTVGNMRIPFRGDLRGLAYTQNLRFRILVVNPADGKILAHADGISPEASAERKSILPVECKDLGNEVWRIDYGEYEGAPTLFLNSRIPNIGNIPKTDPQFFIYVYPAVVREILTHMVFVDGIESVSDPPIDWHRDWLAFTRSLGVDTPDSLNHEDENFDEEAATEWINDVVEAFCNKNYEKFQEYVRKLEGEQ
jgi:hypothetical protein